MRYTTTRAYSGATVDALRVIEETLLPNGFHIVKSDASRLELRGPGMWSSKENPIRGATVVSVEARDSVLHLDTSLGGVARLARFACVFPIVLWFVLGLMSATKAEAGGLLTTKSLYWIGIWLVVGPALAFWIRRRTIGALDTMLLNASFGTGRGRA